MRCIITSKSTHKSLIYKLIFVTLGLMLTPSYSWAQDRLSTSIKLNSKEATVNDFFSSITEQTGLRFAISHHDFDVTRHVKLPYSQATASELLKDLTKPTGHTYKLRNGKYILILKDEVKPVAQVAKPVKKPVVEKTVLVVPEEPVVEEVVIVDTIVRGKPLADHTVINLDSRGPYQKKKEGKTSWAIKTNLLYAATLTPNLGLEIGFNPQISLNITGGYNPWNREGKRDDNDKLVHWTVQPELRYWFCERASGHFIGVHGIVAKYNIGGYKFLNAFDKDYRYEGWGVGGGLTYGYSWMFSKRWALEAYVGAGIIQLDDKKTDNRDWCCTEKESRSKTYFGPTKAGISLIYTIK